MAINPNNALDLKNVCFVADSGQGKGVAIHELGLIPARPCLAMFDPYGEYRWKNKKGGLSGKAVYHFSERKTFSKAFSTAWNSKKPFRLAYSPKSGTNRDELLWYCGLIWAAADGNRELHSLVEEMARMTESSGKESSQLGENYTGGRKFGLVNMASFQRSVEIPKTIWTQSPIKVIGGQGTMIDVKRMAIELTSSLDDVINLGKMNEVFRVDSKKTRLHYIVKSHGLGNVEKVAANVPQNIKLLKKVPATLRKSPDYRLANA